MNKISPKKDCGNHGVKIANEMEAAVVSGTSQRLFRLMCGKLRSVQLHDCLAECFKFDFQQTDIILTSTTDDFSDVSLDLPTESKAELNVQLMRRVLFKLDGEALIKVITFLFRDI